METLRYKIIKSDEQYWEYCNILESLLENKVSVSAEDEIELLTLLVEKWDDERRTMNDADPVELLKYLMDENKIKAKGLADFLGISKSTVSEILHYRKGFSKDIIRKLAERFKVRQEAFNRPYQLISLADGSKPSVDLKRSIGGLTPAH